MEMSVEQLGEGIVCICLEEIRKNNRMSGSICPWHLEVWDWYLIQHSFLIQNTTPHISIMQ